MRFTKGDTQVYCGRFILFWGIMAWGRYKAEVHMYPLKGLSYEKEVSSEFALFLSLLQIVCIMRRKQ